MSREIVWTAQFKKDYHLAVKRHMDISLLDDVIRALARGDTLPEKYRDHRIGRATGSAISSRIGC